MNKLTLNSFETSGKDRRVKLIFLALYSWPLSPSCAIAKVITLVHIAFLSSTDAEANGKNDRSLAVMFVATTQG